MCGIVGYVGKSQAAPVLLDGLAKLEYRGYDSAGMAVYDGNKIAFEKALGRLKVLSEKTHDGETMPGTIGIGHTRWATHGEPSEINSHPHLNESETIAVVHNGIIENYAKLKDKLISRGYSFKSQTDTEVVAHLLDYYYKGDPLEAITKVMHRVEGSYALGIIFAEHPDEIFAVRKDSPLIVGRGKDGNLIASDVPAVLKYTRNVYFIDNGEIAHLTEDAIDFFDVDGQPIEKESKTIEWDAEAASKGGYEYFMEKEIHEQPKTIRDTLSHHVKDGKVNIEGFNMSEDDMRQISRIRIVACGSAYHTGVTAKYIYEGMCRIPVECDLASEFRYRNPILDPNELVVIISQSGETADSKAALIYAKEQGIRTLAIVNVEGSSIARDADIVVLTYAGPEIAVATTKAYSAQLMTHYLLAISFGKALGKVSEEDEAKYIQSMRKLPEQIEMVLNNKERIQRFANRYVTAHDVYFIGRGVDYAISLEASLKLKEISYIHSEAYAAGELKHGTISLIEEGTLVGAVCTQKELLPKSISNIVEVKSRGAFVIAVTTVGNTEVEEVADYVMYIPETDQYFTNSLAIIPLQLFAYYVTLGKGFDVDKPRNLAKSVTVE
ncbi:MAG: glutamine--fructose-6-phosphate transaminase (isomerizing) [Pseudobutyrivibrio sp.]|nr:glutamine--fructose-6-phosphate transaminase (isomerizing) [Pseudobutyrivibrio sp.]